MRRSRRMKTLIARRSWISERKSWLYNCEESLGSQICRKVWETCSKKHVSRRDQAKTESPPARASEDVEEIATVAMSTGQKEAVQEELGQVG